MAGIHLFFLVVAFSVVATYKIPSLTVPVVVSSQFLDRLDGVKARLALWALIGDLAPLQDALTCKH